MVKHMINKLGASLFDGPISDDDDVLQGIALLVGFLSLPFLAMIAYFNCWI